MNKILIIGGASQDILHINNKLLKTIGGAGLYTALGAKAAGAEVDMFAPLPKPIPKLMQPITKHINWIGPSVAQEEIPHFEIMYDKNCVATYTTVEPRAEAKLSPNDLPKDLSKYSYVHIVQLGNIDLQLRMLLKCRQNNAKHISVSGGHKLNHNEIKKLKTLIDDADLCFMNEHEASQNLGMLDNIKLKPNKILFVTHGRNGINILQNSTIQKVNVLPLASVDPTGAGDSFCGALLSYLAKLQHPILAAKNASKIASITISHEGAKGLLSSQPKPNNLNPKSTSINIDLLHKIAKTMSDNKIGQIPYTFTGTHHPNIGNPHTLNFFFALTLQQFGFWYSNKTNYTKPMIAKIDNQLLKGSDFVQYAYYRTLNNDPDFFTVDRQANLSIDELRHTFSDDNGDCPMPNIESHLSEAQTYGKDMLTLKKEPIDIIKQISKSQTPLSDFLRILWHIGGYKSDPFQKKASLLAYILINRPEKFIKVSSEDKELPCIDYHLMRSALRTGMVRINDINLSQKIINRGFVDHEEEHNIRYSVYKSIQILASLSNCLDMVSIDQFFFEMRNTCPEMTAPKCDNCLLDPICMKEKNLFQPVIRTTHY